MTDHMMTCDEVDARLTAWTDGTLDAEECARVAHHLERCEACASLANDLASIAAAARALPDLEAPAARLWDGIARRIETPVVALSAVLPAPRTPWRAGWLVAAAAALVLVTAGITYTVVARRDAVRGIPGTVVATAPTATNSAGNSAPSDALEVLPASGAQADAQLAHRAAEAYDQEIARLRAILDARRDELDTVTVNVIEHNLAVIDTAIRQSAAALAHDPGSALLVDQLNDARDKQLDLLRTAAALPRRS